MLAGEMPRARPELMMAGKISDEEFGAVPPDDVVVPPDVVVAPTAPAHRPI